MRHNYIVILFLFISTCLYAQDIETGSCTTKDGGQYHGQMFRGKPNGIGKTTYKKGDVYEGEYMKGMRHGEGTYTLANGSKHKRHWFQD